MRRKNIKERIKIYFFQNPNAKLRFRELERILELPLPSVIRYTRELKEEGILNVIKIGEIIFYTTDKTNPKYILEKKLYNLKVLYTSGLVNYLRKEFNNPTIIVFGSYSKGEDIEDSDIDLYIETASKKEIKIEEFEKNLKRKIQLFKYKNIKQIKNYHLRNNIINGIVLNGFIEVFSDERI